MNENEYGLAMTKAISQLSTEQFITVVNRTSTYDESMPIVYYIDEIDEVFSDMKPYEILNVAEDVRVYDDYLYQDGGGDYHSTNCVSDCISADILAESVISHSDKFADIPSLNIVIQEYESKAISLTKTDADILIYALTFLEPHASKNRELIAALRERLVNAF